MLISYYIQEWVVCMTSASSASVSPVTFWRAVSPACRPVTAPKILLLLCLSPKPVEIVASSASVTKHLVTIRILHLENSICTYTSSLRRFRPYSIRVSSVTSVSHSVFLSVGLIPAPLKRTPQNKRNKSIRKKKRKRKRRTNQKRENITKRKRRREKRKSALPLAALNSPKSSWVFDLTQEIEEFSFVLSCFVPIDVLSLELLYNSAHSRSQPVP